MGFPNNMHLFQQQLFRSRVTGCCMLLFSLTAWLLPTTCEGQPASIMSKIELAWKEREKSVTSLDCVWSATMLFGAKTRSFYDENGNTCWLPREDSTVDQESRLRLLSSNKMRYEFNGAQLVEETRSFEPRWYLSVTDGRIQKSFYDQDKTTEELRFHPSGFINKETELPEITTVHLWPLLVLYRPSQSFPALGFDLRKFSEKGQVIIANKECLRLEHIDDSGRKVELYVAMGHDFVPVRIRTLRRGGASTNSDRWHVSVLMNIDYGEQTDGIPKPIGWRTALMRGDGRVMEQMDAVVKKFQTNIEIPSSVFHFDFPVGSVVSDFKNSEYYILRDGGEKRHITRAEQIADVPYKILLTTASGEALGTPSHSWALYLILLVSGLIVASLVGWSVYTRLLKKGKEGSVP